jgi:GNAT superfamily N-acetyltransferase
MAEYDSGDGRWSVKPTFLPTLNFHQFEPHVRFNRADQDSNNGPHIHSVEIESHGPDHPDNETIGRLEWHADRGEILGVHVDAPYRRMGIANTLFHEAKEHARAQGLTEPIHSNDRSDVGEAWAKQAGGEIPKRYRLPKRGEE